MVSLAPPLEAPSVAAPARAWPRAAVPALAALFTFAVVAFAPQVLNDGDSWWHLAAGRWMLAHREVLRTDVFSYTFAGRPWHTHEWLSEVLGALAFDLAGWSGVLLLHALAAAAAMAVVARRLARSLPPLSVALALSLVFACAAPSLLARPHLLALPLLAVWTDGLLAARAAGRAPPVRLAGLMILWANLHGGYVLGLALIAPFALEATLAAGKDRAAALRAWGLFGAASLGAALATPFGLSGLTYPFQVMGMHDLAAIAEWRPADFSRPGPLEITLLVTLYVLLARGVRLPPLRLLLLLLLTHMALQQSRHQIVLAVVGAMLLAEPLGAAAAPAGAPLNRRLPWAAAACGAAALLLASLRLALPAAPADRLTAPTSALAHVPAALAAQPVFNSYAFGGYLIWRGVRPFIDGRGDMYGDAFLDAAVRAERGDPAALDAALGRWDVRWTLLSPSDRAVQLMDRRPGWRRLYADRYAVVHVRDGAPGA
jgi:hypothetical protein